MTALRRALLALALATTACHDAPQPPPQTPQPPAQVAPARPPLAHVSALAGSVTVTAKGGAAAPAQMSQNLSAGDALETGAAAKVAVTFADGHVVELGENGRLVLGEEQSAGAVSLELQQGIILSRTPERSGGSGGIELDVLTPVGMTRLVSDDAKASEVALGVKKDKAELEVKLGSITVLSRAGDKEQKSAAGAGDKVELSLGSVSLTRAAPARPAKVTATLDVDGITIVRGAKGKPEKVTRGTREVGAGSQLQVVAGNASLALGHATARLAKGTRAHLGPAGADGTPALQLDSGEASFTIDGQGQALHVGELAIAGGSDAQFAVSASGKSREVRVASGELTVERGDEKVTVRSGERLAVAPRAKLVAREEARAEVTLPSGKHRTVYGISAVRQLAVSWPADACSSDCRIEVARDAGFNDLLVRGPVFHDHVNVAAQRGSLFWRVYAGKNPQPVAEGSAALLEEHASSDKLSNPHNEVLDNGVKTVVYFQSKLPEITLSWAANPKAATYRVRVFAAGELQKALLDRTVDAPRVVLEPGQLGEGSFFWSQVPLDASGSELSGGRMNPLEITYDNSVPTLALLSPRPNQPVGRRAHLAGIAPLGSRVTLAGQALPLDPKGRFTTDVGVPSTGLLVFALDRAGASEIYLRRLRTH